MRPGQPSSAQPASIRSIRCIAATCLAVSLGGTVFLVYEFGFAAHPHRVGFACILAASYLGCSGAGLLLMHSGWIRRISKLPARRSSSTSLR